MTLEERFWPKVDFLGPNGCWNWSAALSPTGYGRIGLTRQRGHVGAHRVAWSLVHGPIPAGLEIDHLCHNRRCVNPGHLQLVTHAENMRRQLRALSPTCARGHRYGDNKDPLRRRVCLECCRIRDRKRRPRKTEAGR